MTKELFREDGYLKECSATVTNADERGVCVDQTVFYPMGGGQPGDIGVFTRAKGSKLQIVDTRKDSETGDHLHLVEDGANLPDVGEKVTLHIDWERRHRLMRMHSCMHMLCAVVPAPVTGGSIRDGSARLDFDLQDTLNKDEITDKLNELIQQDSPMTLQWITDDDLDSQPDLVRTMSVQPPKGSGRVRLVNFSGIDLQPCGGTHVASSGEIGPVRVSKIAKKGKHNRRVIVEFAE